MNETTTRGELEQWVEEQSVCKEHSIPLVEIPIAGLLDKARSIDARIRDLTEQRDALAAALLTTIAGWESWAHDELDGTSLLDDELAKIEPARAVLARARGEA